MTSLEAKEIARVLATADGGCSHCALTLAEKMAEKFPDFDWDSLVREAGDWTVSETPKQ